MIHNSQVYSQYLKHMEGVREVMNYSGAVLLSTTAHSHPVEAEPPFQPACIYLLIKRKPLSLRNDEISENAEQI